MTSIMELYNFLLWYNRWEELYGQHWPFHRIIVKSLAIIKIPLFTEICWLVAQMVNNQPATQETRFRFLGWKDPLEKGMATHPSILAWEIWWTEEPGGLQSMGLQRVGQDSTHTHTCTHTRYMPSGGIAGSYGSFIPGFLRNLHNGCIHLLSHQQCKRIFFHIFSTSSQAFIVSMFFY